MKLYTVGHSNHSQAEFLKLLETHNIDCVADVRSIPASSHNPQYNRDALEGFLNSHGIRYEFFGREFGARRMDSFNNDGQVDFEKAVNTTLFQQGVEKMINITNSHIVTLMCSEAEPLECHRFALVARYFHEHNYEVLHILKDASAIPHYKLEQEMVKSYLNVKKRVLPDVDELFGTYTKQEQLKDAYLLKNKEIGFRLKQEDYYD